MMNSRQRKIRLLFLLLIFGLSACGGQDEPAPVPTWPPLTPQVAVLADGFVNPLGLALLPDGGLLVAEEGSGDGDLSAGVSLITAEGTIGRLISGLPSSRDAGDLAGVPLVAVDPAGERIYLGHFQFSDGHLWTLPLPEGRLALPLVPYTQADLTPAMLPSGDVFLTNPFDMTFDHQGRPVVSDASGNGVAQATADGGTRFFHRFAPLPDPADPAVQIDAVPTGISRVGAEYYVTLTGGCPYPAGSGQLVAITENRDQRTVVDGLNMPIDVAQGPDGTIWVLEFAQFNPDGSCFGGDGYLPRTGRLSRYRGRGVLEPVLTDLDFPGAVLPLPDGSLYVSEIFAGRVLHVTFDDGAAEPRPVATAAPTENRPWGFREVAAARGIAFQHGAFRTGLSMDPNAMMGGGLCWIDYDNDGWQDLYLVNSHALAETEMWLADGGLPTNALFHNDGGTFSDVSAGSGADLALRGNGCVAADFNRDGWLDLYVTVDGPNALLWNNGDGTFSEGAAAAGVDAPEWSTATAVSDVNGDGWPDFFVAAYIDLEKMIDTPSGAFPQDFLGLLDRLYLSQGAGPDGRVTFIDMALPVGLEREERGLGAIFFDADEDGDPDLYIANDGHPNRLYLSEATADAPYVRFVDVTRDAGVGDSGSGMGIAAGDYDGNGLIDLFVTNWMAEINALYQNESTGGAAAFQYSTYRIGLGGLGEGLTGWGTAWADFDHDTDVDLLVAHGHVPITDLAADADLVRFYLNRLAEGYPDAFRNWTEQVGLEAVGPLLSRGSAVADFDNDGDLDVAINTIGGAAALLLNEGVYGHWLQIAAAEFAPGLQVHAELPGGQVLLRELLVGSSYLASEDPRLHFGLGAATRVLRLEVRWPDGRVTELTNVAADQVLTVAPEE